MPLFNRGQDQAGANWEPQAADGRLADTAGAKQGGVFTSDLSVSEYVLLGEAADLAPARFPEALSLGGATLPLTYRFDPGEDDALVAANRTRESIFHFREVIRLEPAYAEAHRQLDLALAHRP